MSKLDALKQLAAQSAATAVDMNEAESGGGAARIVPEGYYLGRVVEYVDLGNQPDVYEGVVKGAKPAFRLGVALFGDGGATDEQGNPLILRTQDMFVKRNEKAGTFLAFKTLNWKQDPAVKHFSQFLGEPFLFYVKKGVGKQSKREYNALVLNKTLPPIEPISKQFYPVPVVADDYYRLFLWDQPTLEAWNELEIKGNKEDGSSKNFIQETILSASDFQGSALQHLLASSGVEYKVPEPKAAPAQVAAAPVVAAPETPAVAAVVAPQVVAQPAQVVAPQVAVPLAQVAAAPVVAAPSIQTPLPGSASVSTVTTSPTNPAAPGFPAFPNLPTIPGGA